MTEQYTEDTNFLANLPKTAIQAIYNAVTGKTENLSKNIEGNVVITSSDIDRLYAMIIDQINLHPKVADPTTTIVVKNDNDKTVTYSSWERYQVLRVNNHDVTSDITIKVEFVTQLPGTATPQRCIVNINLDSSLPVLLAQRKEALEVEPLGFLILFSAKWRTAKISIDFVDFLIAKSFVTIVEEWMQSVKRAPSRKGNRFLLDHMSLFRTMLQQLGRVGMAGFLIAFAAMSNPDTSNILYVTLGVGFGLIIWAALELFETIATKHLIRRVSYNMIPTVILLNDADSDRYSEILKETNSAVITTINIVLSVFAALTLNIIASYVYTYLST